MHADGATRCACARASPAVKISAPIGQCALYLYGRETSPRVHARRPRSDAVDVAIAVSESDGPGP